MNKCTDIFYKFTVQTELSLCTYEDYPDNNCVTKQSLIITFMIKYGPKALTLRALYEKKINHINILGIIDELIFLFTRLKCYLPNSIYLVPLISIKYMHFYCC